MEPFLRQLKIIQMALLAGVASYVVVAEAAGPKKGEPLQIIILAAGGLSLCGAFSCFWIRRRLVFSKTMMILHIEPENAAALPSWKAWNLAGLMISESVALWGLVLRFQGAQLPQVAPFYAAGFCLLLLLHPRRP